MSGPQVLLSSFADYEMEQKTGVVCYFNWADDRGLGRDTWKQACFADLSCIKTSVRGEAAFMSARIGHKDRECDDAFVKFLCDKDVSPWRVFADELFPSEPRFLDYKGTKVDINSHEFRRDVGIILTKHVSRRIAINFLKAYRLLGEHPAYVEAWYRFVQAGFHPSDAMWCAQFCHPDYDTYTVPWCYSHSIFRCGAEDMLIDLVNLHNGNLNRDTYRDDASMLISTYSSSYYGASQFNGCDAIFTNETASVKPIRCSMSETISRRLKDFMTTTSNERPVGGLRLRETSLLSAIDCDTVHKFFGSFIEEYIK